MVTSMTMDMQTLIVSLLIGAIAGWLAGQVMRGAGFGLLGNVLLGMVGAIVAGWLFPGFLPITGIAGAIVQSAIGAIIVLAVVGLVKRVAT
jgi:uncharacterized membrane protein YeaQ/YmgE (transglycosylase-associated protein family)